MSNHDEDDEVALVVRLTWQVVRKNSFPPPGAHASWTTDAIIDQVADLYLAKGAAIVAEAKAAAGGDQSHLERRLLKTIRNYMIDLAKSTPIGLMRNRLATMLLRHPDYVRLEGDGYAIPGWAPVGSRGAAGAPWQGEEEVLLAAAANTKVASGIVFNKSGPPPSATKEALLQVIAAVFAASDGCYLTDQTLARLIAHRFDEFLNPDGRDAAAYTTPADPSTISDLSPADLAADESLESVDAAGVADWLWIEFTREERIVSRSLDACQGEDGRLTSVALALGCGEEEARATIGATFAKIREHAGNAEFARRVLHELTAIHERDHGDPPGGTT